MIKNFEQLAAHLSLRKRKSRLAVVCGSDISTLTAVVRTLEEGFAEALFVGHIEKIRQHEDLLSSVSSHIRFIEASDDAEAAKKAVALVRQGEADVLVKGLVSTDVLLRAVLNKQTGLLPAGNVLSHVAVAEFRVLGRFLLFSDAAVIPYPTAEQRRAQIDYLADICRAMGIEKPRLSLLHCSEHVSDKFPHTLDYRTIIEEAGAGQWGEISIDGPLDLRTSIDPEALHVKGIASPIEGQADALVFPDIEAANTFYKTITFLGNATAGMLCGTTNPVVLPSRGDDATTKYFSIALAALKHK